MLRHSLALLTEMINGKAPKEWEKAYTEPVISSRRIYSSGSSGCRLTAGFEGGPEQEIHQYSEHPSRLPTGLGHSPRENPLVRIPYDSPFESVHRKCSVHSQARATLPNV